ncbi:Protein-L-isoaspartate O-methyltransferase [Candidatus Rhodobacter oscarellae]|uniref:Protein-L-isoaspartate O-methyltransferase n=1 Tax=Candidatus Rhodobacter oscarellae TaxID=1675527 RepID=A0A0J9E6N8_9RHOB|nr:protein-L-isoaspartate O-methyltransferase [Candidatus Rhodobacter lobularis]KMW58440.1 Protein-L-isoaspartate O-methyltransferase [Candidatus Rhodobacter lobularis]
MADSTVQRTMMVDTQIRPSDVTKFPIIDAMLTVRREDFVPDAARSTAYMDGPVELGHGRSLLEPRTFAKMLDALDIQPDELVLDIGTGLGYSAAVIARLAEAVVALEEDESLAGEAETILGETHADNVAVVTGALADGAPKHGPYDVVVLQGAVEQIPDTLVEQTKSGGRIAAIFMDGALGTCRIGWKSDTGMTWRDSFNASAEILDGFRKAAAFQL